MFSHLIVALIAALLLSVAGHPVHSHSPSQTTTPTPTTTGDCSEPTSSPIISLTPTPTSAPPTSAPPTTAPPTPTSPTPTPTPTTTSAPSTPTGVSTVVSNAVNTGGVATYFYQNGNPGACGQVHSDSDFICAMDQALFGTSGPASPLCGLQVQITNLDNGESITVTVADDCPTCENANSIDLSVGAFEALSALSVGVFPISWSYV